MMTTISSSCQHTDKIRVRDGDVVCKHCGLVLNERIRNINGAAFREFVLLNGRVPKTAEGRQFCLDTEPVIIGH